MDWTCGVILWLIAIIWIIGGGAVWISGMVSNTTYMQVIGNVAVAYLPVIFCAMGACKLMKKKDYYEQVV